MTLVGRRLLPVKTPAQRLLDEPADLPDLLNIYRLEERVLRVRLKPDAELVGRSLADSRIMTTHDEPDHEGPDDEEKQHQEATRAD